MSNDNRFSTMYLIVENAKIILYTIDMSLIKIILKFYITINNTSMSHNHMKHKQWHVEQV